MTRSEDEGELVGRIQKGDAAAFRSIADSFAPRLLNFAAKMLRNQAQAEDAAQEALVRLWTNRHAFRGEGSLRSYLFQMTHRICLDVLKSPMTQRYGGEVLEDLTDESVPHPEQALLARDRAALLQTEILLLPERQRAALLLRVQEGLSQREVATVLGESEETVESLLARARRHLKSRMEGLGHE